MVRARGSPAHYLPLRTPGKHLQGEGGCAERRKRSGRGQENTALYFTNIDEQPTGIQATLVIATTVPGALNRREGSGSRRAVAGP